MTKALYRIFLFLFLFIYLIGCASVQNQYSWKRAGANETIQLPRDHFAHDDFRTEWWYYTGNVKDKNGNEYAFQVVFFKRRPDSTDATSYLIRYFSDPAYMSHFHITDFTNDFFVFDERLDRDVKDGGKAGARTDMFYVWNGDWSVKQIGDRFLLQTNTVKGSLDLLLTPVKPFVIHGSDGFFVKAEGNHSSYYISGTRMKAEGILEIGDRHIEVSGWSWTDHEYGSRMMSRAEIGWDWFSIQLDDNYELMLYLFRHKDGSYDAQSGGTLVASDGSTAHIGLNDIVIEKTRFWTSEKTDGRYPVDWRISLPRYDLDLTVKVKKDQQEVLTPKSTRITYYEGSIRITGRNQGRPVTGVGFLELTGYDRPLVELSGNSEVSGSDFEQDQK